MFNLQSGTCRKDLQARFIVCDFRALEREAARGVGDRAEAGLSQHRPCPPADPWLPRAGWLDAPPLNMHLWQRGYFERIIFKTLQTQEKR